MKIIDGRHVADAIRQDLRHEIKILKEKGLVPGLAVIIVGQDPGSQSYVKSKEKSCKDLGMYSVRHNLASETSESELLDLIKQLNNDDKIHGILVQLPVPKHIDSMKIIEAIDPKKDVDGFHPINVGKLVIGQEGMKPCTPYGVIKMLEHYDIDIEGKHAVILGRSNIVGKPAAQLLLQKNATVTICHSKTKDLNRVLKSADILIVAIGKPFFVTKEMVKKGAVVIDVGINRLDSALVGDVAFDEVKDITSYISPVPGGVGPMTIVMLMSNTITAAKNSMLT